MLSVLIVNWNTRELLAACLRSLIRFPASVEAEILVVDNASTDGSAEMVRKEFPEVRLIAEGKNLGYARGNNEAFAAAGGEFLLTLNPDTEVEEGTLDTALAAFKAHPKAGCVSVKFVGPGGNTQRSVRGFPTAAGIIGDVLHLRFGLFDSYRLTNFDYEREQEAPQPMGTFLMFRRAALESVGDSRRPFDENFPIFFNEVDLLLRLKSAGWSTLYTPKAQILHHGGESTKQVRKSMIWESHRSLIRFMRKHSGSAGKLGTMLVTPIVYASAYVRARGFSSGWRAND